MVGNKYAVALVGYGGMGHWHARLLKEFEEIFLYGIYDINPEKLAAAKADGYVAYNSFAELCADETVDVVLVATPNDFHKEYIIGAMRAGKAAISEKPVTLSSADLQDMIDVSRETGKLFTVHQNRRWDKDYRIMREVFESGELGNVYSIQSRLHGARGAMFGWRAEPEHGGGMIYDWGVHFIDQLLWMLGYDSIKSVFCTTVKVKTPEVEDYFYLVMDLKNGCHIQMEVGTWVLKQLPRWMVLGDKGTLYINDFTRNGGVISVDETVEPEEIVVMTTSGPTRTFAPRGAKEILEHELPDSPAELTEYYTNLRDAVDGKAELIVKPCQVRRVFEVLEAMFKSAATGDQIKF